MKPTCIVCLALIEEDDPTRINARGGVMHADCDPEAIRCPHLRGDSAMTDKDALARTLALESAVLDELREVHADTREAARAVMRKGDRLVIWDGEGDAAVALGDVSVTNPKVSCRIQDWGLFTAWAMKNAPEFVHEVTVLKVSQRLVDKVCDGEGEYIDADGVAHLPDGVGRSSATPQLRVKITDAGREKARQILAWMPKEVEK